MATAKPREGSSAWAGVCDTDRQLALTSARDDALAHVLASIRRVSLGRSTLADALALKDIYDEVSDWLMNLPVTRVNYRRDLQVEMTLAATPDAMFEILRMAIERHPDLGAPSTEAGWLPVPRGSAGAGKR